MSTKSGRNGGTTLPDGDESSDGTALISEMGNQADVTIYPELETRQVQAAMMLVTGRRQVDIAAELKVTPETVTRWKRQPEFIALCNLLIRESLEETAGGLRRLATKATGRLETCIDSPDERIALAASLAALRLRSQFDAEAGKLLTDAEDVEIRQLEADVKRRLRRIGMPR